MPIASATSDDLVNRILIGRKPVNADLTKDAGMLLGAFGLLGFKAPSSTPTLAMWPSLAAAASAIFARPSKI